MAAVKLLLASAIIILYSYWSITSAISGSTAWWFIILTGAVSLLVVLNLLNRRRSLLSNFPVLGYIRFFLEKFRPEIRQYFIESDSDGAPFSRRQRTLVYTRAKDERKNVPFGTHEDMSKPGYEWISHTLYAAKFNVSDLRVNVGGVDCRQPYSCSILNIGAMSYGALSKTAIMALNNGSAKGNFAHNTGEGGISEYHLQGGDLIWQIGTGYFGCRDKSGNFDDDIFRINALRPQVKMIELKLSQGAKPGSGGILPAVKNTWEIAAVRNVRPGTDVISPPSHSAFSDAVSLMHFIRHLRNLSEGKPVGIKLCIGRKQEFEDICNAMISTGVFPDYICIDGAEGGTGSAPPEFSDYLGMPLADALSYVNGILIRYRLRNQIKLFAAGKIISAFDMIKHMALGADAFYSARGMMFSLGCIQALVCDKGSCPVGIATQNRYLYEGLDVTDKQNRVFMYHKNTMVAFVKLMEACGYRQTDDIRLSDIHRRTHDGQIVQLDKIYKQEISTFNLITNENYNHEKQTAKTG